MIGANRLRSSRRYVCRVDAGAQDLVNLNPSQIAAQIASGTGFIGAGLIFVRRNIVRGLTTAASIWLVTAVGTTAGSGLIIPAAVATAAHFAITYLHPWISRKANLEERRFHHISVRYADGTGALRKIVLMCA